MTAEAVLDARDAALRALLGALRRTAARHSQFAQAVAAQLGIGTTDLDCLLLLSDFGPASAGQLAEVLGLTTGAVTGVVDRLVAAGFVVRETDPSDRRRVIVQAVADQARRVEDLFAPVLTNLGHALELFSDESLSQLVDFERRASSALEQATARLRADQAGTGLNGVASFSSALLGLEAASLEFAVGASNLRVLAAEASVDELYRATFEGIQPSVRVQGGLVAVRYKRIGPFEWRAVKHAGSVYLSPRVAWTIALRGGAAGVELDMRGLDLRGLSIEGGASKVDVVLPVPRGTVSVCLDGGANRVQIQHPARAPVQLQVHGGANRLEFDAQRFGAVGGDVRLATPGWELAADRYMVEVGGGASRLAVQEQQEMSRSC